MPEQPHSESADDQLISFEDHQERPTKPEARWNPGRRTSSNAALFRLVFLAGLLIMVVWAMQVSGRAETWRWLFRDQPRPVQEGEPESSGVDNLFVAAAPNGQVMETGKSVEEEPDDKPDHLDVAQVPEFDTASQYELEFLRRFLQSLTGREQAEFFALVHHVANHKELPGGETAVASSLIRKFKSRWNTWQAKWKSLARESVINEPLNQEIEQTNLQWNETIIPELDSALIASVDSSAKAEFVEFRQTLRQAADSLVSHSTQVGRPVESYAWVAAWSDLYDQPMAMDGSDLPHPTITQILGQPNVWAGQTVAINGTALLVQRAAAGKNPLGIRDYHVIWIRPDHVSSFPFCLYTLMPPESLALTDDETQRSVEIPVSASVRFFKVRMFDGGEGQPGQAPLMMAATLELVPPKQKTETGAPFQFPGAGTTAGVIILIAVLAGWLAWLAYRTSLSGKARGEPSHKRLQTTMQHLKDDPNVETIHEKLGRMEHESNQSTE